MIAWTRLKAKFMEKPWVQLGPKSLTQKNKKKNLHLNFEFSINITSYHTHILGLTSSVIKQISSALRSTPISWSDLDSYIIPVIFRQKKKPVIHVSLTNLPKYLNKLLSVKACSVKCIQFIKEAWMKKKMTRESWAFCWQNMELKYR